MSQSPDPVQRQSAELSSHAYFVQIPLPLIDYILSLKLTGTQHDLLLLLWKLDPFGDRWIEIPPPENLAQLLQVDARTIQRAAQKLQDVKLCDFEIKRWKFKNSKAFTAFFDFSTDKGIQLSKIGSLCPKLDQIVQKRTKRSRTESLRSKGSGDSVEKGNVPNKEQTCLENKQTGTGTPTRHPVCNEQERIGTPLPEMLRQVEAAGICLNKTLRIEIQRLTDTVGEPAAAERLRNALSAFQEQQEQGSVRNPGGLFLAALRKAYTANRAKKHNREKRPHPPNLTTVEIAIDQALMAGDRPFALAKLQQLWAEGWHSETEELCLIRKDWGFKATAEGVKEK